MKEIPLTQGMVALVDDEDYERLVRFKWHCMVGRRTFYAGRNKTLPNRKRNRIYMHRIILNTPFGYETDHINGNGLDNRKENLRVATRTQNQHHGDIPRNNTSGFKGVCWHKVHKKWVAQIRVNRRGIHLGLFKDKNEAAITYNVAAIKYHGEFARLNRIDGLI